ncbi:MAG TPA: transglutaminase domain-containing protein [Candidatus Dojkabacteria bacterium]|nr:transglutaminase domain-containing protein [Candidatus Dojkabacteria bacterium]
MKSLIGYLKKILLNTSFFLLLFSLFPSSLFAQEPIFQINSYFSHLVRDSAIETTATVQLTANTTRVLSIYTTTIDAPNVKPTCYINKTEVIECKSYSRGELTDIQIDLKNRVIPANEFFEISFIYETSINNSISYNFKSNILDSTLKEVIIKYPKEKGDYSWSSELISSKIQEGKNIVLTVKNPINTETTLYFSEGIQFKFSVNRVFTNSTEESQTFELILPMDSERQTIIWQSISPLPSWSSIDEDGNYIFNYIVKPKETINCNILGYIQDNNNPPKEFENKAFLTKQVGYWEISEKVEIKRLLSFMKDKGLEINENATDINLLGDREKSLFYRYIYQYVIYRLNFNSNTILGNIETKRLGASGIIKDSNNATPIDFADYYIALLRYFSIPSRLVLGYISDISNKTTDGYYHYWVEYYDLKEKKWFISDPFLEKFTKKSLFGSSFPDHIEILKRGKNPMSPTLSFYSPSDFQVSLSEDLEVKKIINLNTTLSFENYNVTKNFVKTFIDISNTGTVAISNIALIKSNISNISKYLDSTTNINSFLILPKQNINLQLNIPIEKIYSSKIFLSGNANNASGLISEFYVEKDIPENTPFYINIITKILSLLLFVVFIIIGTLIIKSIKKKIWTK